MITYWVQATPENTKLLKLNPDYSEPNCILVVSQENNYKGVAGPFSDVTALRVMRDLPEYKYHEKTKQFIPANSKLFEEEKQERSVVKAPDFKIKVGDIVMVSPDSEFSEIAGKDVTVMSIDFVFKDSLYATVATETKIFIIEQNQLFPSFTEHEKKIKQFIQDNYCSLGALTKFNVTREELAEFLLSKQNNQETK